MPNDRSKSPGPGPVIQAFFQKGRPPASLVTRTFRSPYRPPLTPHAATLQTKANGLPPHPATVQTKRAGLAQQAQKPPHAATLQKKEMAGYSPHAATLGKAATLQKKAKPAKAAAPPPARLLGPIAQRSPLGDDVHAFQTPADFLDASSRRESAELPPVVRRKMETFFEEDLSEVRIHVGPEAGSIGAIAFTLGTDIYFAPGQYEPHTPRGQELLGHELTHVLQQRDGRVANPFGDGTAVVQDPALEEEADRMGRLIAAQAKPSTSYRREREDKSDARSSSRARESSGRSAQQKRSGYKLVLGAYMHEEGEDLPEPLAGHAFVALEDPKGQREAYGFSPAHYGEYDPRRDLGKLQAGVPGVVHDDGAALEKPGVKTRTYEIDAKQADAARKVVDEYRAGKKPFTLKGRQCTAFAADVAKAADVKEAEGLRGKAPREVYRKL